VLKHCTMKTYGASFSVAVCKVPRIVNLDFGRSASGVELPVLIG
jgi:hypothetical protein